MQNRTKNLRYNTPKLYCSVDETSCLDLISLVLTV